MWQYSRQSTCTEICIHFFGHTYRLATRSLTPKSPYLKKSSNSTHHIEIEKVLSAFARILASVSVTVQMVAARKVFKYTHLLMWSEREREREGERALFQMCDCQHISFLANRIYCIQNENNIYLFGFAKCSRDRSSFHTLTIINWKAFPQVLLADL